LVNHLKVWHHLLKIFFMTLLIYAGFLGKNLAHGQTGTILAVSPQVTNLYFNGELSTQVQITITDVESLNAFDITLLYDGTITSVTSHSEGGFLINPYCPVKNNDPGSGYLRYSCTQFDQPPVGGSGSLINLTFTGIVPGITSVIIDEQSLKLPDGNNQPVPVTVQNGTINVGYATSAVAGNIFLQGQSARAGVPISLGTGETYAQGPFTALSTPTLRFNLDFGSVVNNDNYTFTTAQPGYLNLNLSLVVPPGNDLALPPLRLLAGDAMADNAITTADLDAIRDAFDVIGLGNAADLNDDGMVDVRDLALAAGNYGLSSANAYGSWLP